MKFFVEHSKEKSEVKAVDPAAVFPCPQPLHDTPEQAAAALDASREMYLAAETARAAAK